jgi:late competence protein required for DNA uptake (superfamily II DNA/RNA helicase)
MSEVQKNIYNLYKQYETFSPPKKSACDNKGAIKLTNMQNFISNYAIDNIKNKNGLFLYHTVGSGKTLTGVNTMKYFENKGFSLLWITRTTLRKDLQKAIDMVDIKSNITTLSYKQFSNVCKKKGEIYKKLLSKSIKKGGKEFLYKTLVVIDEAHKLYTKDLKAQEMHDIKAIETAIFNSYKTSSIPCKIILMSATPMTKDPKEIISLINLLKSKETDRLSLNVEKYINGDTVSDEFKNKIQGLFSYINTACDYSKFAHSKIHYIPVEISDLSKITNDSCMQEYRKCLKNPFVLNKESCKSKHNQCKDNIKDSKEFKPYKFGQKKILHEKCNLVLSN